jgi:hypothetical protein
VQYFICTTTDAFKAMILQVVPTFWKKIVLNDHRYNTSGSANALEENSTNISTLKMKAAPLFQMLVRACPTTWHYFPHDTKFISVLRVNRNVCNEK